MRDEHGNFIRVYANAYKIAVMNVFKNHASYVFSDQEIHSVGKIVKYTTVRLFDDLLFILFIWILYTQEAPELMNFRVSGEGDDVFVCYDYHKIHGKKNIKLVLHTSVFKVLQ
jgi:hypothetical protein